MKKYLLPSIKLTLLCIVLLMGVYTLVLLGIAKILPGQGEGKMISYSGKTYYANIGQQFTADKYFWSRPSAIGYNPIPSGGSNWGPNNPELLQAVQARIDTFLAHNPEVNKSEIPVDMVTASSSGLDPNISIKAARVQVKRIAAVRNYPEEKINQLVSEHIEAPFLGLFGPEKINVLKLNLALDELQQE